MNNRSGVKIRLCHGPKNTQKFRNFIGLNNYAELQFFFSLKHLPTRNYKNLSTNNKNYFINASINTQEIKYQYSVMIDISYL